MGVGVAIDKHLRRPSTDFTPPRGNRGGGWNGRSHDFLAVEPRDLQIVQNPKVTTVDPETVKRKFVAFRREEHGFVFL